MNPYDDGNARRIADAQAAVLHALQQDADSFHGGAHDVRCAGQAINAYEGAVEATEVDERRTQEQWHTESVPGSMG